MNELAGLGISQLGAGAILAIVVLLILTGRLVPRSTLEDVRQERDTWREAHGVSEEARHVAQGQVGELLELSRAAGNVLGSLPRPGEVTDDAMDEAPR